MRPNKKESIKRNPASVPERQRRDVVLAPSPYTRFYILLLILIVLIVFSPTFQGGYIYDEIEVIQKNTVMFHMPWSELLFTKKYFLSTQEASYRPVVTLTYLIDNAIWGLDRPGGWRFTSLLFHIATVLLLFRILQLLRLSSITAFLGSLLFAIHPLHVDTVCGIGFREDQVVAFLMLAVIYLYYLYLNERDSFRRNLLMIAAAVSTLLAQLSKENAFLAPIFVAAAVWALPPPQQHKKFAPSPWQNALPFLAAISAVTVVGVLIRFVIMVTPDIPPAHPLGGSSEKAFLYVPWIFIRYGLIHFLWPSGIVGDYSISASDISMWQNVIGWIGTLGVVLVFFGALGKLPRLVIFGLFWFALAWAPTSNVMPLFTPVANRYSYFPDMGLCLVIAWALDQVLARIAAGQSWHGLSAKVQKSILYGASTVVLLVFAGMAFYQAYLWIEPGRFWEHNIEIRRKSLAAHHSLAALYLNNARPYEEQARILQQRLVRMNQEHAAPESMQRVQKQLKDTADKGFQWRKKAINISAEAYKLDPSDGTTCINFATLLRQDGQLKLAEKIFQRLIKAYPLERNSNFNLGLLYLQQEKPNYELALRHLQIAEQSGHPEAHAIIERVTQQMQQGK